MSHQISIPDRPVFNHVHAQELFEIFPCRACWGTDLDDACISSPKFSYPTNVDNCYMVTHECSVDNLFYNIRGLSQASVINAWNRTQPVHNPETCNHLWRFSTVAEDKEMCRRCESHRSVSSSEGYATNWRDFHDT
jgi:hypothetical protein